jgi:hypothetical protein
MSWASSAALPEQQMLPFLLTAAVRNAMKVQLATWPCGHFPKTFLMSPTFFWILPPTFSSVPLAARSGLSDAHEKVPHAKGVGEEVILAAVRIASIIHALAAVVDAGTAVASATA